MWVIPVTVVSFSVCLLHGHTTARHRMTDVQRIAEISCVF